MNPEIIFEDEDLIILNKPTGWIVNEAKTTGNNPVVQSWLKRNFSYKISRSSDLRSGIVHRLDKDTSGILVVAKNVPMFERLQLQFKERIVEKVYLALSHGLLKPEVGSINVPVGRLPWNRERFGIVPGGREALTNYKVQDYFRTNSETRTREDYSLLQLNPKTGRTHQIRIHLKYLGHPIVSDLFYVGRKTFRKDVLWCPRLFLHAARISFMHPTKNKIIAYHSDLPKELKEVLDKLVKITTT